MQSFFNYGHTGGAKLRRQAANCEMRANFYLQREILNENFENIDLSKYTFSNSGRSKTPRKHLNNDTFFRPPPSEMMKSVFLPPRKKFVATAGRPQAPAAFSSVALCRITKTGCNDPSNADKKCRQTRAPGQNRNIAVGDLIRPF